jgi:hypothetical protein
MAARKTNPAIDPHDYVGEAVAAMCLALPDDTPAARLCFGVLYVILGLLDGEKVRQSDLDGLYADLDAVAQAMAPPPP